MSLLTSVGRGVGRGGFSGAEPMPRDANVAGSDKRAVLPAAVVVSNVEARAVGEAGKGGSEFAAFSLTIPANATPGDTIFVRVPLPLEPATATRVSASGLAGRFVRAISASIGLGALAVVLVAVAVQLAPAGVQWLQRNGMPSDAFAGPADRGAQVLRGYTEMAATFLFAKLELPWTICRHPLELVELTPNEMWRQTYVMSRKLFEMKTPFQHLQVFESPTLGRVLALDGVLQLSQRFEANYHEMMAHVPVNILLGPDGVRSDPGSNMAAPNLRVLILGGGDGGVATRLLQHEEVAAVTMCEIDQVVVDSSRTWFDSALNAGFNDPRLTLLVGDATAWVRRQSMLPAEERVLYDLVIIDTTDWSLGGEWSLDFYVMLSFLMTPRSLVVANLDTPLLTSSAVMPAVGGLRTVFQHVDLYMLYQPEFVTGGYTFMIASAAVGAREARVGWEAWDAKALTTQYYSRDVHTAAFALPAFLRRAVDNAAA